jgi:glycosyltransferase involved in cell wall biosynthesis
MISIVMSTTQKDENYIQRAIKTSGLKDVEFLCYENNNEFSLTEIYNRGLKESKNDIVVFIHDDLEFESESKWGKKLVTHFNSSNYGILGKAGCTEMPKSATWWGNPSEMVGRVHHQMIHPKTGKKVKWLSEYSGSFGGEIIPVVAVDGLFFAVHKKRIKKNFDENIKGFHLYEVDFCINNFIESVNIGVVFDFPISHKSIGQTNEQWEENRKQVADKYADTLPLTINTELIVNHRVVKIKKEPKVTMIIPTKGRVEMIEKLITSIVEKSAYKNIEIIIADTGSSIPEKQEIKNILLRNYSMNGLQCALVEYDYYNFAKINNDVVKNHMSKDTELILFSNNDVVLVNDCISLMVETYLKNRHTCGTVGARLHFENNKIQHAGIFLKQIKDQNTPFIAGHVGYNASYQFQNKTYTVVGNTAAFILVGKTIFEKIGGFNENYIACFEDVELNLEVLLRRHQNMICGEAVAYHLESQTREAGVKPEDLERLNDFIKRYYEKLNQFILQPNA